MFLLGRGVQPGLHGAAPALDDLDQGDLKHTVDFRRVYASVLEDWLQAGAQPVLKGTFKRLGIVA